jgi:ParB-like chromosome segregation protein Spo0J
MQLKIEYLSKNDLKPYVNNAKIHTDGQVEQIRKSIEEFDFNDPIAVWGENEIVEGHGRLLAAMEMDNLDTVPVIRLDHLTDKQRKAYALAHNKLTMNTDFDLEILSKEVADIEDTIDLTDLGFNEAELLELEIDDSMPSDFGSNSSPVQPEITHETQYPPQDGGVNDFVGQKEDHQEITREEINQYAAKAAESSLVTRRIIIIYKDDREEKFLKEMLGVKDEQLGVIYKAEELMNGNKDE